MKSVRELLSLIMVGAILFASAFSTSAIGFEAETVYESVFVIYSGDSLGSGFAIGENCVVTNAHVIDDKNQITVKTYGDDEYDAYVIGMDTEADIAVLVVEEIKFTFLPVADLSTMKTGDDIYAIGAPKGMAYTLTKGGISAKERKISGSSYIQIDAPINEGNSGGPLLNDAGQVLGVNTLKMSDSEGIGLAIPITRVCEYIKSLGVELDANGNVVGRVDAPEPETNIAPENEGGNEKIIYKYKTSKITYAAFFVAVLSLAGNVVLAILLNKEKKKKIAPPYDPSERTDFDIDILE